MASKKFDIVFSNPPYNGNIDLKILQAIWTVSNEIIFIHPATWCFAKNFYKKDYLKFLIENKHHLDSIKLFWGNHLFNIKLFTSLCISHWTPNNYCEKTTVVDLAFCKKNYKGELGEFSVHGDNNQFKLFKNNIVEYMKNHSGSLLDHSIKNDYVGMTDYSVRFAIVRGNVSNKNGHSDNFYSLINKKRNTNKCKADFRYSAAGSSYRDLTIWSFNTEVEQNNFINYCCTKVVRFLLTFTKTNANVMRGGRVTDIIPWMDFTQEWNDAKLCKEFQISKELWDYIDNFIPDYYDEYKSGF